MEAPVSIVSSLVSAIFTDKIFNTQLTQTCAQYQNIVSQVSNVADLCYLTLYEKLALIEPNMFIPTVFVWKLVLSIFFVIL